MRKDITTALLDKNVKSACDILDKYKVSVRSDSGGWRNYKNVLKELSDKWNMPLYKRVFYFIRTKVKNIRK